MKIIPALSMWPRSQPAKQKRTSGHGPMSVLVIYCRPVSIINGECGVNTQFARYSSLNTHEGSQWAAAKDGLN